MADLHPRPPDPPPPSLLKPQKKTMKKCREIPKKPPQRGLGVAQLEKLRLQQQQQNHHHQQQKQQLDGGEQVDDALKPSRSDGEAISLSFRLYQYHHLLSNRHRHRPHRHAHQPHIHHSLNPSHELDTHSNPPSLHHKCTNYIGPKHTWICNYSNTPAMDVRATRVDGNGSVSIVNERNTFDVPPARNAFPEIPAANGGSAFKSMQKININSCNHVDQQNILVLSDEGRASRRAYNHGGPDGSDPYLYPCGSIPPSPQLSPRGLCYSNQILQSSRAARFTAHHLRRHHYHHTCGSPLLSGDAALNSVSITDDVPVEVAGKQGCRQILCRNGDKTRNSVGDLRTDVKEGNFSVTPLDRLTDESSRPTNEREAKGQRTGFGGGHGCSPFTVLPTLPNILTSSMSSSGASAVENLYSRQNLQHSAEKNCNGDNPLTMKIRSFSTMTNDCALMKASCTEAKEEDEESTSFGHVSLPFAVLQSVQKDIAEEEVEKICRDLNGRLPLTAVRPISNLSGSNQINSEDKRHATVCPGYQNEAGLNQDSVSTSHGFSHGLSVQYASCEQHCKALILTPDLQRFTDHVCGPAEQYLAPRNLIHDSYVQDCKTLSAGDKTGELSSVQSISLFSTWSPVHQTFNKRKWCWASIDEQGTHAEIFKDIDLNILADEVQSERAECVTGISLPCASDCRECESMIVTRKTNNSLSSTLPLVDITDTSVHGDGFLSLGGTSLDYNARHQTEILTLGPVCTIPELNRIYPQDPNIGSLRSKVIKNHEHANWMIQKASSGSLIKKLDENNARSWMRLKDSCKQADNLEKRFCMMLAENGVDGITRGEGKLELAEKLSWKAEESHESIHILQNYTETPLNLELSLSI